MPIPAREQFNIPLNPRPLVYDSPSDEGNSYNKLLERYVSARNWVSFLFLLRQQKILTSI